MKVKMLKNLKKGDKFVVRFGLANLDEESIRDLISKNPDLVWVRGDYYHKSYETTSLNNPDCHSYRRGSTAVITDLDI